MLTGLKSLAAGVSLAVLMSGAAAAQAIERFELTTPMAGQPQAEQTFGAETAGQPAPGLLAPEVKPIPLPEAPDAPQAAAPAAPAEARPALAPLVSSEAVAGDMASWRAGIAERLQGGSVSVEQATLDRERLAQLYGARDYQPLWLGDADFHQQAAALVTLFENARLEGLLPHDYYPAELRRLLAQSSVEAAVDAELLLSHAVMRYASDTRRGRLEPRAIDRDFDFDRRAMDVPNAAIQVANSADPAETLRNFAPSHPLFASFRRAMAEMQQVVAQGGWSQVSSGPTLRPGETASVVPEIRTRLRQTGEYVGPESGDQLYDPELVRAVERFQERHGLEVDGIVGPATYSALNVTAEERIDQITATMERWRWMPSDLGARYIMVNVPDFQLTLMDGGSLIREMDVIVGRPDRQTPLFSSALTWLEFNPTWTVPTSIARQDILPRLQSDPYYLRSQNMRLYSDWGPDPMEMQAEFMDWRGIGSAISQFMIRQDPGPNNSLGRVKFMMANNFSVYLHDTPSRGLFNRNVRTHSSGCVRVEDPMWLADYLLESNGDWSESRRQNILASGRTTRINMSSSMPLHIVYNSAWAEEDGRLNFRDDIYGIDSVIARALENHRPDRLAVAAAG